MSNELEHDYGSEVHILDDSYLSSGLARLCSPDCRHPELNYWVSRLYTSLLQHAVNSVFERESLEIPTRMHTTHPEAILKTSIPKRKSKIVVACLARAGILPSHVCFDELNHFFEPEGIRQDHILLNRRTDTEERVTGADVRGSKIGGDIQDAYLLIPDPMGATGSTILSTLEQYKSLGTPRAIITMHLIITPEYLQKMRSAHPSVKIFSLRLDRGLSTKRALSQRPGSLWSEEKGLNEKHYIVPGGGGLGEILNNAFI